MKFSNKIILSSLISISFLSGVAAKDDYCKEDKVSIYNIYSGDLLYLSSSSEDQYINSANAYYFHSKEWSQWGNWNIIYNEYNTVSFKNIKSNYCIEFYRTNDKLVQNTCNATNNSQKFKLALVSTGAYTITMADNNQCLSRIPESSGHVVTNSYDSILEKNDTHQWALLPHLVGN